MKCRLPVPRRGRLSPARYAGFTLIEIMIVIGILGIVLAMGVPPFVRSLQKDSLQQAVSDIVKGCGEARERAILQGVPAELVIRADGQLTVATAAQSGAEQTAAGGEPGRQPADATVPTPPVFSAHLREDVAIKLLYVNLKDQMEAQETRVHFYPNGTSDEFTIVLQTDRRVRKISLECVTGLASVEASR